MLQLAGLFNDESANPLTNSNTAINRGGIALDIDIPIFDTGEARVRAARETYMRASIACRDAPSMPAPRRASPTIPTAAPTTSPDLRDRVLPPMGASLRSATRARSEDAHL